MSCSRIRSTIIYLIDHQGHVITTYAAIMAEVTASRMLAQLTSLERAGYLTHAENRFEPTESFSTYKHRVTKTRPTTAAGTSGYDHGRRMRMAQSLKAQRGELPIRAVARAAGIDHAHWLRLESARKSMSWESYCRLLQAIRKLRGTEWWQ
jgi:hypothetical protein